MYKRIIYYLIAFLVGFGYSQDIPSEFEYNQSTSQAFYFVNELDLSHYEVEQGEIILAYNNNVLVGARMWNGQLTDIPVMGYDESDENTYGFCESGQTPKFVLYKVLTGEKVDLDGDNIMPFEHNQVYVIETLNDTLFPHAISLSSPYPNPFNPSTTIEYEVPFGGADINISIFDVRGRLVEVLVDEFKESNVASYKITWNAADMSSGVYFVRMNSLNEVKTQKLMLIK